MKSEKKSYFFFHFGTPVIHTKFHKNILNIKKKGFQVPYLALIRHQAITWTNVQELHKIWGPQNQWFTLIIGITLVLH